ncbi:hypothetical protein EV199_1665 [Pseudobacter ginsenosidimutans]|uniref:Glycosyltransferase n=2 Tax=Pseudobacter ginsenosidimutans TaxID=661488 RepID=A0A4Q7N467_9BACT|nr:glycosyltransferase [Pseudobacter ginsenosidimutans]RZS75792.1 hypothetical protein EV199_1665 [Pseudobacter ginsenosidimutans]
MTQEAVSMASNTIPFRSDQMPDLNFKHIVNLTDLTGIIQHALFSMPNRKEGYCIDDNARALFFTVLACKFNRKDEIAQSLLPVYLGFIHFMQSDDGYFCNFLTYAKEITEHRGSEDSFGRTMMALGFLINEGPSHFAVKTGQEIFAKAYPHVSSLVSIRGMANSIIGICQYIKYHYPDDRKTEMVVTLSDKMIAMYKASKRPGWSWFEPVLTYDNAMLPLALLNAYEITQDEEYLTIGLEAMAFLESKVFVDDKCRPVGNRGWYERGGKPAQFDQQGIDVMAMVLLYQQAFRITRDDQYLQRMQQAYQWFIGENDLGLSLYDTSTGGCADGLQEDAVNLNQGAESTLAYWISHMVVVLGLSE